MVSILIVDDDARIRRILSDFLKREGFKITEAADGGEAVCVFDRLTPDIDLVILDVMMPVLDGWHVLRHIKNKRPDTAVMMLTAKTEDGDQIYGFETGADDYVTKPISPVVLVARVKALLKRNIENALSGKKEYGCITIDELGRCVYCGGQQIVLSPKEFDLLAYLANNSGIALSREQILNAVWGYDYYGDLRTLDTHIKNLRAELGGGAEYIKTVRGYGYKFEVTQ